MWPKKWPEPIEYPPREPEVTPAAEVELKWEKPDLEALVKFMCEEKGFAEDRIRQVGVEEPRPSVAVTISVQF